MREEGHPPPPPPSPPTHTHTHTRQTNNNNSNSNKYINSLGLGRWDIWTPSPLSLQNENNKTAKTNEQTKTQNHELLFPEEEKETNSPSPTPPPRKKEKKKEEGSRSQGQSCIQCEPAAGVPGWTIQLLGWVAQQVKSLSPPSCPRRIGNRSASISSLILLDLLPNPMVARGVDVPRSNYISSQLVPLPLGIVGRLGWWTSGANVVCVRWGEPPRQRFHFCGRGVRDCGRFDGLG